MADIIKFPGVTLRERIRSNFLNPVIHLQDGTILSITDDGETFTASALSGETYVHIVERSPTGFEHALMIQAAILEAKILVLMERHEPENINWDLPPSASISFDEE